MSEAPVKSLDTSIEIYKNASLLKIDPKEQEKLLASFDESMIEIRPDGLIYLPQVFWRQRLNESFGIGQWCLIVKSQTKDPNRSKLYIEGVLIVRGAYVSTAVGEAEYHETNTQQSWASVWESAKSDCITRCCKDLGIASELWQPQFIEAWKAKYAVKVFIERKDGKKGVQYRKVNSEPFYNEKGVVPGQNKKQSVPSLKRGSELWAKAVQYLKDGGSIATIKDKYTLSAADEKTLIVESKNNKSELLERFTKCNTVEEVDNIAKEHKDEIISLGIRDEVLRIRTALKLKTPVNA